MNNSLHNFGAALLTVQTSSRSTSSVRWTLRGTRAVAGQDGEPGGPAAYQGAGGGPRVRRMARQSRTRTAGAACCCRGYGRSWTASACSMRILFGYSFGGQVAAQACLHGRSPVFAEGRPKRLDLGSPPMNFGPMPEETSRLLVQVHSRQRRIRKWAGFVGDWLGELLADRYLPLVLVKNHSVYALERLRGVRPYCRGPPVLVWSATRSSICRVTFLLPQALFRAGAAAAGGPLPGAGRQDRCALLYPDREIFSGPSAVRSRTPALGIPMVAARNCTHSTCFIAAAYWRFRRQSCQSRAGSLRARRPARPARRTRRARRRRG
mmetsp:Transcript_19137/g.56760  ORF Transcript_19137/g.56760 Transcript_19137/m.56760 type:complete len:322 (+) Transcript_19137:50-1015(+)